MGCVFSAQAAEDLAAQQSTGPAVTGFWESFASHVTSTLLRPCTGTRGSWLWRSCCRGVNWQWVPRWRQLPTVSRRTWRVSVAASTTSRKRHTTQRGWLRVSFPDDRSMDYSEVSSAFSKLVETHFLQRCPPVATAGETDSSSANTPASSSSVSPESFPECYKVPHVTLRGHGKRRLSSEDTEEERSAKKPRLDSEVTVFKIFTIKNQLPLMLPLINTCPLLSHTAMRESTGRWILRGSICTSETRPSLVL